ncbi:MAG: LytTR family transcriptional regulator DNA-binding domain-containing protein [Clostridia bacterium]|nr:LytTR family transcriptional regulator DNA-binding domain-containing protein [Clostridia bacterium]
MQNNIDIEVKLDPNYTKPKLIIYTNNINDNINKIISKLQNNNDNTLIGYKDDQGFIIELKKIETIYTENKKVYAKSENETYQLKKRIFELEEALEEFSFVRISNSEIVNFKQVKSINFKIVGTIILNFKSGNKTYVSRRYVKKIKDYLNV